MRLALGFLALAACATNDPATSPGDLRGVSNSGGGLLPCNQSMPWCAWDATYSGDNVTIQSRTTTMKATGTLTPAGVAELDALIAAIPLSTPAEEQQGCADAPIFTFSIDFDHGGSRTYHRACGFDNLEALRTFVNSVHTAMVPQCMGNTRVVCAVP